jgi:hypothetical protein
LTAPDLAMSRSMLWYMFFISIGVMVGGEAADVAPGLGVVPLDSTLGFCALTSGLTSGLGVVPPELSNRSPKYSLFSIRTYSFRCLDDVGVQTFSV